jgi:hypothetical protein
MFIKSEISTRMDNGTYSAAVWPFRRLCYRPAVFFGHLDLRALSFPKFAAFKVPFLKFLFYFIHCIILKLRSFQPHNTGIACMSVHVANMDRAALPLQPNSSSHRVVWAHLISLTLTPSLPH